MKESFEIGKESPDNKYENRWPASLPDFKEKSMRFFKQMQTVNINLMRAVSLGLGMSDSLESFVSKSDNNLRLLHYPGVDKEKFDASEARRIGAHCDYGSLTLLFQVFSPVLCLPG